MLPLGTHLLDYEITGLIGEGGFGIVYLAWDHSLQRKVAIKEYMPASMASRIAGSSAIVVKSERHLDTFKAGLKSFMNEARLLARFDHRRWSRSTASGRRTAPPTWRCRSTRADAQVGARRLGQRAERGAAARLAAPLLDALTVMHAAQCFHRDIAPTTSCSPRPGRCCSTSARRGASSAT
jgi:serine/threonine protein kinase